jgi:hypothetical protein
MARAPFLIAHRHDRPGLAGRRGSELVIYPDSGHGGIFQYHDQFAPVAVQFLDR